MELREIQRIEDEDAKHYFPDLEQGPTYLGVALAGEVGETCNEIKKWHRGSMNIIELREKLYAELPDILIYLVMLAEFMKIDLENAYKEKKEFNERRYRADRS